VAVIAMAKKNKQNTTANSILRRVFTPTEEDLALERKYGLDAIVRMLRREDVSQVLDQVLPYLPSRDRGRPKGHTERTKKWLAALDAGLDAGKKPTTVARDLLEKDGVVAGIRAKADHVVRSRKN